MKHVHSLIGCLVLLCLLCSCQAFQLSTTTTSQTTAKATPTLTLANLMQNSLNAMNALKSLHIESDLGTQLIVNQNQAPTPTPLNQIQLTPFNISTSQMGDTIFPDQSSFHTIQRDNYNADQEILNFFEIHLADKAYVQNNANPAWYQLTPQTAVDPALPGQTNPLDLTKQLLTFNSGVQFQDLGDAPGDNGGTWHRIAVTLNKAQVLKLLSSQAIAPGSVQQLIQQLLSQPAATVDGSMDFNFDTKTFYVQNEDLGINITVVPKNIQEYSTGLSLTHRVDFTRFNDPSITISAPSSATPATNISSILDTSSVPKLQ